jgi:hypothetical protein
MQYMKPGEVIKGVTSEFMYLTNVFWMTTSCTPLLTKDKEIKFPKVQGEMGKDEQNIDLNIVSLKALRNKNGPSGISVDIVVSQSEGVLPSLTEFNYILEQDYGLEGNNTNYFLTLYPEVKLSRTVIRAKMDDDAKLRRAINITSELCQMYEFYRDMRPTFPTIQDLYKKIKDQGYDWNFILEHTRGWWCPENDKHYPYFLSTPDLLKMAEGTYHPFWLEEDKKTVKKEFMGHQNS